MWKRATIFAFTAIACTVLLIQDAAAQGRIIIPRRHDKPPGPPLSPEDAVKKMTVHEGFTVEIVASEPQIVNPVAMTFDERGRIWITESLEYPRRSAGPGRDRVKVLEDTNGDGRMDKVIVFAEGLNIPSGIAVGYGGVWVANSPDILFLQDTDGDGKADKKQVVVTGFGRRDTHELPNSLTWGPDGWLYGLNGVFNHSHVRYSKENPNYKKAGKDHPGWKFTCAMFRIHPRTWEFQIFAEGTSNPWGIAFNDDGEAFVSACVIDHLWHITETGYYHRQGGPYPPHTWKIGSIVKHKHQKAAYCGLEYFDSDAYPKKYRGLMYMGNIHGGCINVDRLHRDGSTYRATPEPDFLTANDAWFMPVDQKTGPDGCLYILDWYDRYHCYQDANADPKGIDRLKGRIYRVRYKNTPRATDFDLKKESDEDLVKRLGSPNIYFRETAQRLLSERLVKRQNVKRLRLFLINLMTDAERSQKPRLHALWALMGAGELDEDTMEKLYHGFTTFSSDLTPWVIRAIGNKRKIESVLLRSRIASTFLGAKPRSLPIVLPEGKNFGDLKPEELSRLLEKTRRPSNDMRTELQIAVAAAKIADKQVDSLHILVNILARSGEDKLIPHIVWNNLQPILEKRAEDFLALAKKHELAASPGFQRMTPYLVERLLARRDKDPKPIAMLLALLVEGKQGNDEGAQRCLDAVARRVQSGEIRGEALNALKNAMEPTLRKILSAQKPGPLFFHAALLAVSWKDKDAIEAVRKVFVLQKPRQETGLRMKALAALIAANHAFLEHDVAEAMADEKAGVEFRGRLLASLGRLNKPFVARVVINNYDSLKPANQPRAIELLTQRASWAKRLLSEMKDHDIPPSALNANQVRRLFALKDDELTKLVAKHWGTIRTERDPKRELIVDKMRYYLRRHPGDAHRGIPLFKKLCGQCHKLHGIGADVGPDITRNGRSSFDQLLSNVFDPSLVIGAAYQSRMLITTDGRSLTGLPVEENDQRVVLKVQGGKLETIARKDIEQYAVSKLSMMPEDVEKQLKPGEWADLFALLTLDLPPNNPAAKRLPLVYEVAPIQVREPAKYNRILAEVAPGFSIAASGEGGVALLPKYQGRKIVVRTHPLRRTQPCVIRATVDIPKDKRTRLLISAAHHAQGDWQLVVKVDGKKLHTALIGPKTTTKGWVDLSIDLSSFAGKRVKLELENRPNDWAFEFGYWGRIEIESK